MNEQIESFLSELIEFALKKYPKAKKIAVNNFVSSATGYPPDANYGNLKADARSYKWNRDTVNAIKFCLDKYYIFISV